MRFFRPLKAEEIEIRVSQCNEKGVSLLAYKTARTDAEILDETVGAENWTCRFYEINGMLFCSLGVRYEKGGEFVYKDDCGSEGSIEKEKSLASDCFKRAGFKHGIGRELYSMPFCWVPADKCNIKQGRNGKPTCFDRFHVQKIIIEDGKIKAVAIANDSIKKVCYVWQEDR